MYFCISVPIISVAFLLFTVKRNDDVINHIKFSQQHANNKCAVSEYISNKTIRT